MPIRAFLLRLMLWSLALAAAAGVLAVLFQGGDLIWRVVGTAIATASACILLIATSRLIDRERTRAAGLLGMGGVIFEYLLALGLIWELLQTLLVGVTDAGGKCIITMVLIGLAAPLIIAALQVPPPSAHRPAALCAALATSSALLVFLVATWWADALFREERWWGTGGTVLLLGALSTLSLLQLASETPRRWRWLGILSGLTACLMLLQQIWVGTSSDLGLVLFSAFLATSCFVGHANACLIVTLRSTQVWLRQGTILFAAATAVLIVLLIAKDRFPPIPIDADLFGRLAGAAGIVTGCGTLALAVLARMNRKVDVEPRSQELESVDLFCPRCRGKYSAPIGDSACPSCGLRISIGVEEPRCANCDYLLRGAVSERCPECGSPIAKPARV